MQGGAAPEEDFLSSPCPPPSSTHHDAASIPPSATRAVQPPIAQRVVRTTTTTVTTSTGDLEDRTEVWVVDPPAVPSECGGAVQSEAGAREGEEDDAQDDFWRLLDGVLEEGRGADFAEDTVW